MTKKVEVLDHVKASNLAFGQFPPLLPQSYAHPSPPLASSKSFKTARGGKGKIENP